MEAIASRYSLPQPMIEKVIPSPARRRASASRARECGEILDEPGHDKSSDLLGGNLPDDKFYAGK